MKIDHLSIPGCYLVHTNAFKDDRGIFVKTYHEKNFHDNGLIFDFKEEYYSVSKRGVMRGMHFQMPPHSHKKMVYCLRGSVFDVFVDLRVGSPTYMQSLSFELNEANGSVLVLDEGIAHGFCALEDESIMIYKTSCEYEPESDTGVLWNSCGVKWPAVANPDLLSERDKNFIVLDELVSPFKYKGNG